MSTRKIILLMARVAGVDVRTSRCGAVLDVGFLGMFANAPEDNFTPEELAEIYRVLLKMLLSGNTSHRREGDKALQLFVRSIMNSSARSPFIKALSLWKPNDISALVGCLIHVVTPTWYAHFCGEAVHPDADHTLAEPRFVESLLIALRRVTFIDKDALHSVVRAGYLDFLTFSAGKEERNTFVRAILCHHQLAVDILSAKASRYKSCEVVKAFDMLSFESREFISKVFQGTADCTGDQLYTFFTAGLVSVK
ncbi:hypothetical protein H0H81_010886 [Sphagnurus paluster]|uniref:Uncharacterized protein n=1 Tax=Sphagnurus paluster TaxID=117069 RepID=A0A9P7FNT1_9AGAR|nr:hypothetical protein H0H81_010886 [Sphagnurus paluster]